MSETEKMPEGEEVKAKAGKKKEKKPLGQEILSWVLTILVAVVGALLIRSLIFEPIKVDGHSMDDTLADGEIMLVSKFDYSTTWLSLPWQSAEAQQQAARLTFGGAPARFDVVICRYPGRGATDFVKRVTGLTGETVSFRSGYLYVNGEQQAETFLNDDYRTGLNSAMEEVYIPAKGDVLAIRDGYLTVKDQIWPWRNGFVTGVAEGGDRLTWNQGRLLLNGKEIRQQGGTWTLGGEAQETSPLEALQGREFLLDEDYFFVCGDHRNNSNDSRSVGPIARSMIVGHVRQVVFPFNRWRGVQ